MSEWRKFEKLVASMESVLLPRGAVVKHPDRIPDIDTGELREVDASIRYSVGSVLLLITIECRKRAKKDDVTWIEQLTQKQRSIGAAKTIAVSESGFTEPAHRKAKLKGIELRTLRKIKPRDIESWVQDLFLSMHYLQFRVVKASVRIDLKEGDVANDIAITHPEWNEPKSFVLPFFTRSNGVTKASLNDILGAQIEDAFQKKIVAEDYGTTSEHSFESVLKPTDLVVETNRGSRSILTITVVAELLVGAKQLTPSGAYVYANAEADVLRRYEFVSEVNGKELTLEVDFAKP